MKSRYRWRALVVTGVLALSMGVSVKPAAASYASIMLNQGKMLMQNNDYNQAFRVFRDLADALPRYAPAHDWLSRLYTRMKLPVDAAREAKLAAELKAKYGHLPADRIEELNILTNTQAMPGPVSTPIMPNPGSSDIQGVPANSYASIWLNRIIFLYMNNTFDLALRGFEDLAKACPRYPAAHEWLAKTYEKLHQPDDAARERKLAVELKEKFGHLPLYMIEEPLDPNDNARIQLQSDPSPSESIEPIDNSQLEQHEH